MNPAAIQEALARVNALKQALGTAASKAGSFVGKEVKGTLENISPAAIGKRWEDTAKAPAEVGAAAIKRAFPGGEEQYAALQGKEPVPTGNMLGGLAHGMVNAYRKLKNKF